MVVEASTGRQNEHVYIVLVHDGHLFEPLGRG